MNSPCLHRSWCLPVSPCEQHVPSCDTRVRHRWKGTSGRVFCPSSNNCTGGISSYCHIPQWTAALRDLRKQWSTTNQKRVQPHIPASGKNNLFPESHSPAKTLLKPLTLISVSHELQCCTMVEHFLITSHYYLYYYFEKSSSSNQKWLEKSREFSSSHRQSMK